jgi:hypothetical protein
LSSVILTGDTSGTLTVSAPLVAGSNTVTLPAATGTISLLERATAVASTSGTSIDFTSIPSWAKRITVMFNGVSTNGTSPIIIQIGSGSVTTSGYISSVSSINGGASATITAGFGIIAATAAADVRTGISTIATLGSNAWVHTSVMNLNSVAATGFAAGSISIGGTLDRVRITTVNGTDAFDAGTINVMWEG